MSDTEVRTCIYPGCERPTVPAHEMGGPQPNFCELEEHNAGTAHLARQADAGGATPAGEGSGGASA